MKPFLIFTSFLLILSSCEKDEIPVPKLDRGDVITQAVGMSTYANQIYFDLETNSFVKDIKKVDWDIAFGCGDHHSLILTNTSKSVSVARKTGASFEDVTSIDGLEFVFESSTGHPDSTAFHDWNDEEIYIIDFGYDEPGTPQGFGKIKLINNDQSSVTFHYGMLADTQYKEITIDKDEAYNAVFFSIKNQSVVSVEPPKSDWDICFTQYIFYFHEFETPYLVSGVLLNRSDVQAYLHDSKDYTNLAFNEVELSDFSSNLDAIGYDWKVFSGGTYTIFNELTYIISSTEGFYYKLRFIDFHDENSGERGFPKFEFQKI